ncbi:hypothetical protein ACFSHQ_06135 [Gemmobacter lanyuensis]
MTNAFDAVLIGAGHNTLAAALHLSVKGWRVGVFEQAAEPGARSRPGPIPYRAFAMTGPR